jgi:hypothetical protein
MILPIVPHFPANAGKAPFEEEHLSPGGQVASARARLGLRTKYIGAWFGRPTGFLPTRRPSVRCPLRSVAT